MEPVTHLLTGACLSRLGFNRRTALATATMVVAAEVPDLDVFWRLRGSVAAFGHHRGFSHSFLGVPADAGAALLIIFVYWQLRGRAKAERRRQAGGELRPWHTPRWGMLFWFACIASLSHILLDFTNNYGVRPFAPFNPRWYSWDIVAIVEPVLLLALAVGLLAPAMLRLINQEISSSRARGVPYGRGGAIFALVFMVALWGFRDYQHRRAVGALLTLDYRQEEPLRVSAYPYPINPFQWHGVVETRDFFALVPVDSLASEVDPQGRMQIRYKPAETPVTLAAKHSYLGRIYLSWAVYPMVEVEEHSTDPTDMYTIRIYDLRYAYPERPAHTLGGTIELDQQLHVVDEYLGGFGGQKRR